jgi:hypothetical protein
MPAVPDGCEGADGFTVRAKMSKSALLRGDDPLTLTTFQDLTEQLWTEGS